MPTFVTGFAATSPCTPVSILSAVLAKKRKISCFDTPVAAISPNCRASSANPFSRPW